ncbi:MAG: Ig-like domain repeat protein [Nocardioides sp.]
MNLRKINTRIVVAGATTALVGGALVATTVAPASAATVSNDYVCTSSFGPMTTTLTVSGDLPVPQYWAGANVPAGLLAVTATASDIPAPMITFGNVTDATAEDFAFDMDGAEVPVPLSGTFASDGEGAYDWNATGSNEPFVTPAPGLQSAVLPASFNLVANSSTMGAIALPCELAEGEEAQTLASIELLKQASATTAKNVSAKKGKKAVVPASVESTSLGGPVSGKVVAKKGKKTLASGMLKKGSVKLNLGKKLKVGKHKITVKYLGVPSVGGSSDKITVTVKKNKKKK